MVCAGVGSGVPSFNTGICLWLRIASYRTVLHHCWIEVFSFWAAVRISFLSQPSTNITRLYFWLGCLAGLGS